MLSRVCHRGHELNLKSLLGLFNLVSLEYLEMIDCESVKMLITELRGVVEIADRIEKSSALYEDGQRCIFAEN
jgi:hypothetical protein